MKAPERVVIPVTELIFGDDIAHPSIGRVRFEYSVQLPTGDVEVCMRRPRDGAFLVITYLPSARVVVVR